MKILVLSPHPDDCEACMGGTIAKLVDEGHDVKVLFFTDCDIYHVSGEIKRSMEALGVKKYYLLNYKRRILDFHRQEILQMLCDQKHVDRVYCPHPEDTHQDHSLVGREAVRAFANKAEILFYIWHKNLAEIKPSVFSILTPEYMDRKIAALRAYKSQRSLRPAYFNDEAFRSMASYYGVMVGERYAEPFTPFRIRH